MLLINCGVLVGWVFGIIFEVKMFEFVIIIVFFGVKGLVGFFGKGLVRLGVWRFYIWFRLCGFGMEIYNCFNL